MSTCADDECEISGGCFSKGVGKAGDPCRICAPAQNQKGWTTIEGCVSSVENNDDGPLTQTELIVIVVAVLLFVVAVIMVIAVICVNKRKRRQEGKESELRNESPSMISTMDHRLGRRQPMSSHPLYSGYHTNGGFLPRHNGYHDNHGYSMDRRDDWTMDSQGMPPPRHHAGANIHIGDERVVQEDFNQPPRDYPSYDIHSDMPLRSHFTDESMSATSQPNKTGFASRSHNRYEDSMPPIANHQWDNTTDSWIHHGLKTQQASASVSVFDNSVVRVPRSRNNIPIEIARRASTESVTEMMDFNELAEENERYNNEHTIHYNDLPIAI